MYICRWSRFERESSMMAQLNAGWVEAQWSW
jgi:hypothetical protein